MVGRLIMSEACIREGTAWLLAREPRFALAAESENALALRRDDGGFSSLLDAILGQQVSVASANAIWRRLEAAGLTSAPEVAAASEDALRACGLSRQKIRYAHALARAELDYDALHHAPDAAVIATLTALPGIGPWTAEIYAMFSLGRADVFAPGDLALQEAARVLFGLPERPKEKPFRAMAEAWSPWRAVAARLLWAYYRKVKDREGVRG
jgi:DNA-3-methyladenine glycosylase II